MIGNHNSFWSMTVILFALIPVKFGMNNKVHPGDSWGIDCLVLRWIVKIVFGDAPDKMAASRKLSLQYYRATVSNTSSKISYLAWGSLSFSIVIKSLETFADRPCSLTCNNFKHGWFGIFFSPNLRKNLV